MPSDARVALAALPRVARVERSAGVVERPARTGDLRAPRDIGVPVDESVHRLVGPGWLVGGQCGDALVVCEQKLGDDARFSVIVRGRVAWSTKALQQPCAPVLVRNGVIALLLCLTPDPVTGTGPTALCALDLASGAIVSLAPASGVRIRVDGAALVVEGGPETVRVTLA